MNMDLEPPKDEFAITSMMDCNGKESSEIIMEEKKEAGVMSMDSISLELNKIISKEATFADLPLSVRTKRSMEDMGLTKEKMTEFHATTIARLLEGKDVMVAASPCARKQLAFLIPAVELLYQAQFTPQKGTGAIFICPTSLMAAWVYLSARDLLKYHVLTLGLVCGYTTPSQEEQILKGVNFLVATPGHLLNHLQNTKGFIYDNLKYLMINDVDRLLNFDEEMRTIISMLPETRQTLVISATEAMKVEDLALLSLHKPDVYIEADDEWERTAIAKNRRKRTTKKGSKCRRKGLKVAKSSHLLRKLNLYGWRIMKNPREYGFL